MSEANNLTAFDADYERTEAAEVYTPPPPGKYTAKIEEVKFGKVGEKQQTMLLWTMRITDGPLTGRRVQLNSSLSFAAMPFLKTNLAVVGINVPKVSMVPPLLPGIIGAVVEVSVKEFKGFTNVDLVSLISPGTGTGAPEEEPIPEEDIPF